MKGSIGDEVKRIDGRGLSIGMAHALMVVGALLSLSGCATAGSTAAAASDPFPSDYKQIVLAQIRSSFFDPTSILGPQLSPPKFAPSWNLGQGDGWTVCLRANAKNQLGAYAGEQDTVFMISGGRVVSSLAGPAPYYCGDVTFAPFPEATVAK